MGFSLLNKVIQTIESAPQQLGVQGVWRSEVKEEVRAQPEPGDMSEVRHPVCPAGHSTLFFFISVA